MVAEVVATTMATTTTTNSRTKMSLIDIGRSNEDDDDDNDVDENDDETMEDEFGPSLIIPITSMKGESNKFIEIFPEEMKETSVKTLMKVLQDEKADKGIWVDAAVTYMQRKQPRDSLTVLQTACELGDDIVPDGTQKDSRVRLLASTGIAHLAVGEQAGGTGTGASNNTKQRQVEKDEIRHLADQKFTQAGKIDTFFPMTWIGRGILNLSMLDHKERREQAKFFFATTLKHCGPVLPALLGMAAVLFNEGDYRGAQDKYSDAIRRYPVRSGASTRVGFALSCYRLGQVDRAKAAFARALVLDPENVPAMVGAAILEMSSFDETTSTSTSNGTNNYKNSTFSMGTEKAIKMISMANLLDHSNAMVQNHLANHYFWKWTPVNGTVTVQIGSNLIKSTQLLPLEPGELIRIGNKFQAIVKDQVVVETLTPTSTSGSTDTNVDVNPEPSVYVYVYKINIPWQGTSSSSSSSSIDIGTNKSSGGTTVGLNVWKKDYERVIDLAKGGYSSTVVQEIQAESLFFLARVHHVREDNEDAYRFYDKACKLAPSLHPARYGLIQTLIIKEQYDDAINHLQQLISAQSATVTAISTTATIRSPSGTPSMSTTTPTTSSSSSAAAYATDALALLGLLQVRSGNDTKTQEEGVANIRKAIELDPTNADLVLLEASALQLNKSDYNKAYDRYKRAVELLQQKSKPIPYNVYNNIGVLCHETKRYDEALVMFQQALTVLDDENAMKTTGSSTAKAPSLNNVGIEGGRIRHADNSMFYGYVDTKIQCCRRPVQGDGAVITDDGNKTKVLQLILDDIYDATLPLFEKDEIQVGVGGGGANNTNDEITRVSAIIERIEQDDNATSYLHLVEAIDLPDIENNENLVSADDDSSTAKKKNKDDEIFSLFVKRENSLLDIKEVTTIAFNIARLHETTGRTIAAIEIHKAIAKRNPAYVNSYLRLACIAVDCGYINECAEWLKIAAVSAPGNSEVLTLIGNLHLSLCDWKPAQTVFDGLMAKKITSVEAYSSLSMGNIYFATLHVKEDRYAKHLQYAADFYKRILTKDPLNAYAANGIGTVLAEKAEIYKAKEVFNRVREVSGDTIADSLLNLGHIYLAQKKHPEALQMYKSYLKRAEDGTTPITSKSRLEDIVDVLLYIAFAYFDWARHTELFNDVNAAPADGRYKEAMEHIRLAISKRSKKDVILKYNLCMTKLQAANCVLQKLTRNIPRTVQEVEEALQGLEDSYKIVEKMLQDKENGEKINIRTSVLEDFLKHCRANITSAQSHLEDEKKRAEEEYAEQEFRRLAAEAAVKEAALKEAIRKQEELKKQEERDRRADAKMKKVDELKAGWTREQIAQETKEKMKATGKKRGRDPAVDDFIVDEEEDDQNNRQGLFDDSDEEDNNRNKKDDDDGAASSRKKRIMNKLNAKKDKAVAANQNDLFGDSDDDVEFETSAKLTTEKKKQETNKGLFGDSSDEEEDGNKDMELDNTIATKASKPAAATPATGKDLFGDSDDDAASDEELVPSDKNKKSNDDSNTKKTAVTSQGLFGDSDDD